MSSWLQRLKPSKKVISFLWPIVALALFSAAGWLLYKTLKKHSWSDFLTAMTAVPHSHVIMAIGMTFLSYIILAGYDFSALHYVKKTVPKMRVFLAAFMGFAFSQNLGVSPITGGSIRLRIYGQAGLRGFDIAKIVAFCILTYSIGLTAIFGCVMAFFPSYLSPIEFLPMWLCKLLGYSTLIILFGYFAWTNRRHAPIQFMGFSFAMPKVGLSLFQLVITILDIGVAAAILYVLLPDSKIIGYQHFFFIYVAASTLGILSHVPGGLGVFEWVVLTMLANYYPTVTVFGALLLFRIIYLFLPLTIAALLLLAIEWRESKKKVDSA